MVAASSTADTAAAIGQVWPTPAVSARKPAARVLLTRMSGSALRQVLPLVLLPSTNTRAVGTPSPVADWSAVAEAMQGACDEGFTVAGVAALPLARGGLPAASASTELCRLLRLPPRQAQALAAAGMAAAEAAAAPPPHAGPAAAAAAARRPPPAAAVVVLALSRDNALAHLQMKMAASGHGGSSARGLAAAVAAAAPPTATKAAAEAQLLHFFNVLAASSGYESKAAGTDDNH